MTERIVSEIRSNIGKGKEYVAQTGSIIFNAVKVTGLGVTGETQWQNENGRWIQVTSKPGLRHLTSVFR